MNKRFLALFLSLSIMTAYATEMTTQSPAQPKTESSIALGVIHGIGIVMSACGCIIVLNAHDYTKVESYFKDGIYTTISKQYPAYVNVITGIATMWVGNMLACLQIIKKQPELSSTSNVNVAQ